MTKPALATAARTTDFPAGVVRQKLEFKSGNEAAALAARDVGFHLMGYFPITPSTEVAENLSKMRADGEHEIVMVAGDGEHGAAGICYGAALGGGRVLNATSSQGLLYALEQLPVQAGTRVPMVLNIAARAISGPLDIRGDHSDIYYALNTGWIMLCARDPQAVYDLNFAAVKIGEHCDVRLPVLVAYDGFFTSHQKRRIQVFDDLKPVRRFLGERPPMPTPLDTEHPTTFGPYMNDPDLINNKVQLSQAMDAARRVIPEVLAELEKLTGRPYPVLDTYQMDDAEVATILINSAAETAKEAADEMRAQGKKVGVLSPNVLRPFPAEEFRRALKRLKAVTIGDRADSYGAGGGNLSLEVRAAIQIDPENHTQVLSRIYGLGGKDFYGADAEQFFAQAIAAAKLGHVDEPFAYYGATAGRPDSRPRPGLPPVTAAEIPRGMAQIQRDPATGRLKVELQPLWKMTEVPNRIGPGHGACPGCGAFPTLHQVYNALEGDVVVLFQTGCAMVVTTGYPATAHRINYIHNLFQNGAATLSGLVEMYHERVRRGELPASKEEITFVMISGDGGMDIGLGPAVGAANRNHRMMILEYDNQGYMNTGAQLSYSTPFGHRTATSEVGKVLPGKRYHHKDTAQIFAACHVPYVFTASEGYPEDLMRKVAKAQWYAKNEGLVYGKILSYCPLNWRTPDDSSQPVLQAAIDSCFFPLYEIEHGHTTLTYDPDATGRRRPVADWLNLMGKTRHLTKPENAEIVEGIQAETERRWQRIKAMHEHPIL
ncbi:MAG: thiamine pyrophosphate-dependent enzyme [Betaproteobacteria bacterium]|nr:thiamine pyrophosphate-dependent enzyme [Betaproteobacteria bacterium]MDH3438423.1 thiamine pyrophosphate-dependent enzyme [Betaproteobacteria bacterium]